MESRIDVTSGIPSGSVKFSSTKSVIIDEIVESLF